MTDAELKLAADVFASVMASVTRIINDSAQRAKIEKQYRDAFEGRAVEWPSHDWYPEFKQES